MDRYSLAAAKLQASKPSMTVMPQNGISASVAISSPAQDVVSLAEMTMEGTSDAAILADKPFFDYLTMPYVGSIAEAFDDDGSGFVRISEVNEFCASIPLDWTLLKWYAIAQSSLLVCLTSLIAHLQDRLLGARVAR